MNKIDNFKKLLIKKKKLLKCIFSTLLFQIIITTLTVFFINKNDDLRNIINNLNNSLLYIFLSFFICIILIFIMILLNMPFYFRFFIFILFSIIQGIFLSLSTRYVPEEIIKTALISTIFIFIIFLLFGFIIIYFGINLSWLGIYLFFGLLALIIIQIVFIFIPTSNVKTRFLSIIGLIIFSIFIVYDTNIILLKYNNNGVDCIRGSLDYYLDIYSMNSQE